MFLYNELGFGLLQNIYRLQTLESGKWKFCSSKAMFLFHGGQFVCPLYLEVIAHKLARVALWCWWRCSCQCTCFLHSLVFCRSNQLLWVSFGKSFLWFLGQMEPASYFVMGLSGRWWQPLKQTAKGLPLVVNTLIMLFNCNMSTHQMP